MVRSTDVLVIGAGLAGITAAMGALEAGASVRIAAKSTECASDHVLGFNAPVRADDSPALFYDDTMRNGSYRTNPALVRAMTENSLGAMKRFEKMGLRFDRGGDGSYSCLQPLGCSVPRLVHIGNATGRTIRSACLRELENRGVTPEYGLRLEALIVRDGAVCGATLLNEKEQTRETVEAGAVVIATGGVHMHRFSTYAACMSGDGVAAAIRAGAAVRDMDCIQFEPCHCIWPKPIGISTTLLSSGGMLFNNKEERFVLREYPAEGAVPKDVLARLVAEEVRAGRGTEHGGVWLDLRKTDQTILRVKHKSYYDLFTAAGIDPFRERIEVGPCAHSFMGGIAVNEYCAASLPGLFAAGEAAGGLHGASRMGGNAGTEIVVFGFIAGRNAANALKNSTGTNAALKEAITYPKNGHCQEFFLSLKAEIQSVMTEKMGVLRTRETAKEAMQELAELKSKAENTEADSFTALTAKRDTESLVTVAEASACAAAEGQSNDK